MTPSLYLLEEQARGLVRERLKSAMPQASTGPMPAQTASFRSVVAGMVAWLSRRQPAPAPRPIRKERASVARYRHRPLPSPRPSLVGRRCERRVPALPGSGADR